MVKDIRSKVEELIADAGIEVGLTAIHIESEAIIEINGHGLFPTASTFKVPVMVEVYAQARAGRFAMTDRIETTEHFRVVGSGVLQTLAAGLTPTVRDLAMLMTIVSDNMATDMLCDRVGLDAVEARMRALGITDIHLPMACHPMLSNAWGIASSPRLDYAALKAASRDRPMGYDSPAFDRSPRNTTTTAHAMAQLMVLIARGQAGHPDDCADILSVMDSQQYVDRVPRFLPQGSTANKTASLRGLRNDVGLIRRGPADRIAFGMFTFDPTVFPTGNSRGLAEANTRVASLMGEVGQILGDGFGHG